MGTALRRVALLVALALMAGCSGSGSGVDDTTAIADVGASVAISTTAPTTSTVEPTTSTTEDPVALAEAAAVEAVMEQGRLWRECIYSLDSCDPDVLQATTTGEPFEALRDRLLGWQAAGYAARPSSDPADSGTDVVEVEVTNDQATAVRVQVCQINGGVLLEPGGAPDGSDLIIDDEVSTSLSDVFVRREGDGVWRVFRAAAVGRVEGVGGCDSL